MAGPEKGIENYTRDLFKYAGWKCYKMSQGGGVADFLMVSPKGFHLWPEFKRPNKKTLDPKQIEWHKDMQERIERGDRGEHCAAIGPINNREQARKLFAMYGDM